MRARYSGAYEWVSIFEPKRNLSICIREVTRFPQWVYISTWIIVLAASQRAWVAEAIRAAAEIRP